MKLNIISQVWPRWYEVSKTVESKPSKNHLESIWKVDQPARNMLWCIRNLFRRRENLTFNRPRLAFSNTTTIMCIIGQAHRTWAELRAILRNDERNAASMTTSCGVGCGLVFVWVKRMSRQGFKGYMHSAELHKEVVVCENTFFLFWMAVFWMAMFWSWLPMFNNVLSNYSIPNLLPFGLKPNKISIWDEVALRTSPLSGFIFRTQKLVSLHEIAKKNIHKITPRYEVFLTTDPVLLQTLSWNQISAVELFAILTWDAARVRDMKMASETGLKLVPTEAMINHLPDLLGGDVTLLTQIYGSGSGKLCVQFRICLLNFYHYHV